MGVHLHDEGMLLSARSADRAPSAAAVLAWPAPSAEGPAGPGTGARGAPAPAAREAAAPLKARPARRAARRADRPDAMAEGAHKNLLPPSHGCGPLLLSFRCLLQQCESGYFLVPP